MKPSVAVALSGGVDSLMAAALLLEQGERPVAVHFTTGYETAPPERIAEIAAQLGIPLEVLDGRAAFRSRVVDYFIRTYRAGRTPNPCLVCNPAIKFGLLMSFATERGAERLATGHYARSVRDETGRPALLRGVDRKKDQSYFLAFLTPEQIERAVFPLGGMTKDAVQRMAAEKGLAPLQNRESQDVCFIRGNYSDFLAAEGQLSSRPGPIVTTDGQQIGEHPGLHHFTVGQRRGIGCPAAEPYYVVRLEPEANRLVVGFKPDVYAAACRVSGINWIAPPLREPVRLQVRVRYRHSAVPAVFLPDIDNGRNGTIRFDVPQKAVTPGQGAVFYDGEQVLGGGWIEGEATR